MNICFPVIFNPKNYLSMFLNDVETIGGYLLYNEFNEIRSWQEGIGAFFNYMSLLCDLSRIRIEVLLMTKR